MQRGRPVRSEIRSNILELLFFLGKGYGYQISKIYNEVFPQVTQRVIYYHLRKGIQTKEIEVHSIQQEKGNFSWGSEVEKKFYTLGPEALPKGQPRIKEFLEKHHQR
ncbi:hypothetical protein HYT52_05065 [Candidatus Woesearchaeota archaeon]|nr:hypothetical protein [Candidatus Woesearchaeota archaeon]